MFWISQVDGFWDVPANWSTGNLPGPADDVVIDIPADITVTFRSGTGTVHTLRSTNALVLSGGTLSVTSASAIDDAFTLSGGTLAGAGDLSISGLLTWTDGAMQDAGRTIANGDMSIGGSSDHVLGIGRSLDNAGMATWSGSGNIVAESGAVLTNLAGATFDAQTDACICGPGGASFQNLGEVIKSVGTGSTTLAGVQFNNRGRTRVRSGTLQVRGGGTSTGTFLVARGGAIEFTQAGYTLDAGSAFRGPGTARVAGGVVVVNGNVTARNLDVTGSEIDQGLKGTGNLTVTRLFNWTGAGIGNTVTIDRRARLAISGSPTIVNDGTLNNRGTVTVTGGRMRFGRGSIFNNLEGGRVFVQTDQMFVSCCGGGIDRFNNDGLFVTAAGAASTVFDNIQFHNRGKVAVRSGTLELRSLATGSGTFFVSSGAVLTLTNGCCAILEDGAAVVGPGTLRVSNGLVAVHGSVSVDNVILASLGTLFGDGTLTVRRSLTWTGGAIGANGPCEFGCRGTTTIAEDARLFISGAADKQLLLHTLNNGGSAVWMGTGKVLIGSEAAFRNLATGKFDAQSDACICATDGATSTFDNAGRFVKSAGTGKTLFSGVEINNSGTVELRIGALSIDRDYTQSSTASLNIAIGGSTMCDSFGRLEVSGAASFAGTLNVRLRDRCSPSPGQTFVILTFGARSGDFSVVTGITPRFRREDSATSVALVAN